MNQIIPFGANALHCSVTDPARVAAHIRDTLGSRTVNVVPAHECVLVTYASPVTGHTVTALRSIIAQTPADIDGDGDTTAHTIPVIYNGSDLSRVAEALNMDTDAVVAAHTSPVYTVDYLGFAPGFGYLSHTAGDAARLDVPRLETPRTRIPAGSVGVADNRTCIYPNASPGGWNLIGHTDVTLFNPDDSNNPTLFRPGDTVRFSPTTR